MTTRQAFSTLVIYGAVVLGAMIAAAVLAAFGKMDGATVSAILMGGLGWAGGAASAHGTQAINGGVRPDLGALSKTDPALAREVAATMYPATVTPPPVEPVAPPPGHDPVATAQEMAHGSTA